jgi:hypothetical protein
VIYYLPLLALTETLIVATNLLLQVTPFMMALSTLTVFFLVPGIVALGVGLGAAYPDFKAENPAQTVTSFGGLHLHDRKRRPHRAGAAAPGRPGLPHLHGRPPRPAPRSGPLGVDLRRLRRWPSR